MLELNKIYNMDCMEGMKQMPDKSVDLLLCDPPYGVNIKYNEYKDTEENWYSLMDKFIPEARRIAKMVVFPSCQIKRLKWFYDNYPPDWIICWHKGSPGHVSYVGFNDWEPHMVYGKTQGICMHDYFSIPNTEKMGNYGHPCPKPIRWAKWFISGATKKGGVVCDTFAGSGTTAIAAYDLERNYMAFEIDKDYYDAAVKRIEQHKAQISFDTITEESPEQVMLEV